MADTLSEVKAILGKFCKNKEAIETAGPQTHIQRELGVSSANLIDMVLEFEDGFNISIADDELPQIQTLGDAVRLIEKKKGVV